MLAREREIAGFASATREAGGGGSVVLVFGQAGIGDSGLAETLHGMLPPRGRLLVGCCDDLATPRTLGPFRDLVGSVGPDLTAALRAGGDRSRVLDALHTELSRSLQPTVLVIEDVHRADAATLNVLCFLVRRMAELPAVLLLLTYRDGDLGPTHPLRRVLWQAARVPHLHRLALPDGERHLTFLRQMNATRAALALATGAWDRAVSDANRALAAQPTIEPHLIWQALVVLGRIKVRRGLPGGEASLARAWRLAQRTGELRHSGPVAAARAEAAWLRGDHAAMVSLLEPVYAESCQPGAEPYRAELGYWLAKSGHPVAPDESGHPYALQAAGHVRKAAAAWLDAGCPYEHAAAMAESTDPDDLLAALTQLDGLGAKPLARRVRNRLRELGVPRIPRGTINSTRRNPAGLTDRQLEVARLLGEGLTNAEIACRLFVSVRTIHNHVAAVFDKLGARSRHAIAARFAALGLSHDEK